MSKHNRERKAIWKLRLHPKQIGFRCPAMVLAGMKRAPQMRLPPVSGNDPISFTTYRNIPPKRNRRPVTTQEKVEHNWPGLKYNFEGVV